jgi:FixJ family two-component response regulator
VSRHGHVGMADRNKVIAVVDDETKMRRALARLLKTHGYEVAPFELGDDFLKAVQSDWPDCILLDLHMPRTTGFYVLEAMATMHVAVPIIVITGHDGPGYAERVRGLGAADYLLKPVHESVLVEAIQRACLGPSRASNQKF